MNPFKSFSLVFMLCFSFHLQGQVTSVYYQLAFVDSTDHYQLNLVIGAGSATSAVQRLQSNAQYSLVFPDDLTFSFVEFLMPLQGNQFYTGTTPTTYDDYSTDDALGSTYVAIVPAISPSSYYNDVYANDTIPLFIFDVGGYDSGVRLYENGVDPDASHFSSGTNYSQGFTMGSLQQLYTGNLPTRIMATPAPPEPVDPVFHVGDEYNSINKPLHIGVQIDTPAVSSILDLESTSKGFLPPRMTTVQVLTIQEPAIGLTVYCTTEEMLVFYTGSYWRRSDGEPLE